MLKLKEVMSEGWWDNLSDAAKKAYIKKHGEAPNVAGDDEDEVSKNLELNSDRFDEMKAREQFILTVTENGYGKRTSSYQFRISNRGGSGIMCINASKRNGKVLASFPVDNDDDIMLITKSGQLIRCPVKDVRIAGRNTQGVSIFKTSENELVVSASRVELDN